MRVGKGRIMGSGFKGRDRFVFFFKLIKDSRKWVFILNGRIFNFE